METIHEACGLTTSMFLLSHFEASNTLAEAMLDTMQEGNTALGMFSARDFSLEKQDHPLPDQVRKLLKTNKANTASSLAGLEHMPEFQMFADPDTFCYREDGTAHTANLAAYAK